MYHENYNLNNNDGLHGDDKDLNFAPSTPCYPMPYCPMMSHYRMDPYMNREEEAMPISGYRPNGGHGGGFGPGHGGGFGPGHGGGFGPGHGGGFGPGHQFFNPWFFFGAWPYYDESPYYDDCYGDDCY